MAFAINLYNALIIHALVVYGTRMSTVQRSRFYSQDARYNLGGHDYTADDLENGILRGNRSAASNLFNLVGLPQFSGGQFRGGDPRLAKVCACACVCVHARLVLSMLALGVGIVLACALVRRAASVCACLRA